MEIEGRYLSGDTSQVVDATLLVDDVADPIVKIVLQDQTALIRTVTSISDRLGQMDRQITFADGDVFSSADHAAIDQLTMLRRGVFSRVHGIEQFRPRLLIFIVLAIAAVFFLIRDGLPLAATVAAWATPPKAVAYLDQSALSSLDRFVFEKSKLSDVRRRKLTEGFEGLLAFVDESERERFSLQFRGGGFIGPNALALPDGTIIITDELVALLDEEQSVAVFAHEIAHVTEKHSLKRMYRALGFAGIVTLIGGDLSSALEEVIGGGGLLLTMADSREMELDADEKGVELLSRAGLNPKALQSALAQMQKAICDTHGIDCSKTGWLASHPGGDERDAALERAIEQLP